MNPAWALFLDSGAFSLRRKKGITEADYLKYMDGYADSIRKLGDRITFYANVDVIGDPDQTWRNQQYLEKEHGLTPIPVVHWGSKPVVLDRYLNGGYTYIGLGGLLKGGIEGRAIDRATRRVGWLTDTFKQIGSVRTHGFGITFGVTTTTLMSRYPWWSIDNSTWLKEAALGGILVPKKRNGEFIFTEAGFLMKFSRELLPSNRFHYGKLPSLAKGIVIEWLEHINLSVIAVVNDPAARQQANLFYFERLRRALPNRPRIYYSGASRGAWPQLPGKPLRVMVAYDGSYTSLVSSLRKPENKKRRIPPKTNPDKEMDPMSLFNLVPNKEIA